MATVYCELRVVGLIWSCCCYGTASERAGGVASTMCRAAASTSGTTVVLRHSASSAAMSARVPSPRPVSTCVGQCGCVGVWVCGWRALVRLCAAVACQRSSHVRVDCGQAHTRCRGAANAPAQGALPRRRPRAGLWGGPRPSTPRCHRRPAGPAQQHVQWQVTSRWQHA